MRDDQWQKIKDLQDKLIDVVLVEADPENWPGAGVKLSDLTREERGDMYWCKKNAAATMSLLTKACSLEHFSGKYPQRTIEDDSIELEKEIASAERQANDALQRILDRQSQTSH